MQHWIFISSPKRFRMDDCLADNGFVEFVQRNKVEVNDIVYLYTTAPVYRIKYKMVVERINIPKNEWFDDTAYSTEKEPLVFDDDDLFVRLRLVQKADNPNLGLACLRDNGFKGSMQGNFKIQGELLDYIEEEFKCTQYKKTWAKSDIYCAWMENIYAIKNEMEALKEPLARMEEDLKEEYVSLNPLVGPNYLETMKYIGDTRYNLASIAEPLKYIEENLQKAIMAMERAMEYNQK